MIILNWHLNARGCYNMITINGQSLLAIINDKCDYIYDKSEIMEEHMHSPAKVYPSLSTGITITANGTPYVLGNAANIIPLNAITDDFDIHYINVLAASNTAEYELVLYANSVEIARKSLHRNSVPAGTSSEPIQTPIIDANAVISAKLASSSGGASIVISLAYHLY